MDSAVKAMGQKLKMERATRPELKALVDKQGRACAMTGVTLTPDVAELDHIIPVSQGGDHSIGNLQVVHKVVNRMKGAMGNEEFVRWCMLIAENHRSGGRVEKPTGTPPGS